MKTDSSDYSEYLEDKYLPGRDVYLHKLFYPRIVKELDTSKTVIDLGFGAGSFLKFLRAHNINGFGIDSNAQFVEQSQANGFDTALDDITKLSTLPSKVDNVISDNVLEHLNMEQLESVFARLSEKLTPSGQFVAIVPDKKGFEKDPTHETFISKPLIEDLSKRNDLGLKKSFCFPFNSRFVGRFFYLNMQIFVIGKLPNA